MNPDLVSMLELRDILHWREQLSQGNDDVYLSISSNDLTKLSKQHTTLINPLSPPELRRSSPIQKDLHLHSLHSENHYLTPESSPYLVPSSPVDRNNPYLIPGSSFEISSPDVGRISPFHFDSDRLNSGSKQSHTTSHHRSNPHLNRMKQGLDRNSLYLSHVPSEINTSMPQLTRMSNEHNNSSPQLSKSHDEMARVSPLLNAMSRDLGINSPLSNVISRDLGRNSPLSNAIGRDLGRQSPHSNAMGRDLGRHSPLSVAMSRDLARSSSPMNAMSRNMTKSSPLMNTTGSDMGRSSPYLYKGNQYLTRKSPHLDKVTREISHSSPHLDSVTQDLNRSSPLLDLRSNDVNKISPHLSKMNPDIHRSNPQLSTINPEIRKSSPQLSTVNPEIRRSSPQLSRVTDDINRTSPQLYNGRDLTRNSPHLNRSPEIQNSPVPESYRRSPHIMLSSPDLSQSSPVISEGRTSPYLSPDYHKTGRKCLHPMEKHRAQNNRTPKLRFKGIEENEYYDDGHLQSGFDENFDNNIDAAKGIIRIEDSQTKEEQYEKILGEHRQKAREQLHREDRDKADKRKTNLKYKDVRPLNERRSVSVPRLDVRDISTGESYTILSDNVTHMDELPKGMMEGHDTLKQRSGLHERPGTPATVVTEHMWQSRLQESHGIPADEFVEHPHQCELQERPGTPATLVMEHPYQLYELNYQPEVSYLQAQHQYQQQQDKLRKEHAEYVQQQQQQLKEQQYIQQQEHLQQQRLLQQQLNEQELLLKDLQQQKEQLDRLHKLHEEQEGGQTQQLDRLMVPPTYPNGNDERYVDLSMADTPRSTEMPATLQHIDIKALKHNEPQNQTGKPQKLDDKLLDLHLHLDARHRLQSSDSLVDSGIAPTQSTTDASGASVSTNGLSPNYSVGQSDTMQYDGPAGNVSETHGVSDSHEEQSKSVPNLSATSGLTLTQANLQAVVNSKLSAEDKLGLMAAMCENLQSPDEVTKSDLLADINLANRLEGEDRRMTVSADAMQSDSGDTQITEILKTHGHVDGPIRTPENRIRTQSPIKQVTSYTIKCRDTKDEIATVDWGEGHSHEVPGGMIEVVEHTSSTRVRPPSRSQLLRNKTFDIPNSRIPIDNHQDNKLKPGDLALHLDLDDEEFGQSEGANKHYGIDIEEWIGNQDLEGVADFPPDSSDMEDWQSMTDYVEKWRHAKQGRLVENLTSVTKMEQTGEMRLTTYIVNQICQYLLFILK